MVAALLAALALASAAAPPAPTVTATVAPATGTVTIRFRSPGRGLRYVCSLDAAPFAPCRSPHQARVEPGTHVFRVRAIARSGRRSALARTTALVRAPALAVGREPVSLAFGAGSLWTADYGAGTVTRVDPGSRRRLATVDVGGSPGGIAATSNGVWVGNFAADVGVAQIDPATNAVVRRLAVAAQPVGLLVDGPTLWVADYTGAVERVDSASGGVVARVAIGGNPEALLLAFGLLWVTNYDGSLSTVDPVTNGLVGGKITGDSDLDAVTATADAVWSTSFYGNSLLRIDPQTRAVTRRIALPAHGSGVLAVNGSLWVSVYDANVVLQIDPSSGRVLRRVPVGSEPRDLVFDGAALWSVNQASSSISRLTP